MPPAVLSRHDLPDGSSHFDLFVARDESAGGPDDRVLLTIRFFQRPDGPGVSLTTGERLPDHRRMYMKHEGPVSGGRGVLTRVAAGSAHILQEATDRLVLSLDLGTGIFRLSGEPDPAAPSSNRWLFTVER